MKRIPEPEELMDGADQALAYASEDFSEARDLFVDAFGELFPVAFSGKLLDLGCGPADIPMALAEQHPGLEVDAVDGAPAMLEQARRLLETKPTINNRIRLIQDYLPSAKLAPGTYDAVVSNSLLHHLEDPGVLWTTIKRSAKPGAGVCVMDLVRPPDKAGVDALVATYADESPAVLRQDFRNSLFAAYEIPEVEAQLADAGLSSLKVRGISDRHLLISGFLP